MVRLKRWSRFAALMFGVLVLGSSSSSSTFVPASRIVVYKNRGDTAPLPADILDRISGAGFSVLADYETMAVFKGPAAQSSSLLAAMSGLGRDAERPNDLDSFWYHGQSIDSDDGPTPGGGSGPVYFLTFQSYVKDYWLTDVEAQGVRILQALGSAAYVVRLNGADPAALLKSQPWLRGCFPVPAALKAVGFDQGGDGESPFRRVMLRVSEETGDEPIVGFLASLSATPVLLVERSNGEVQYEASLTDLDVSNLSLVDRVFEISPVGRPAISSERVSQLIAQNGTVTNGESTLPSPNPSGNTYLQWLVSKGFTITDKTFDNTKVGLIDTGFDNQSSSTFVYNTIHPDFKFTYLNQGLTIPVSPETGIWPNWDDRDYHGTLTASIIAGYPAADRADTSGYLYSLGVAPTVRLAVDKYFDCDHPDGSVFDAVIGRVVNNGANVVNMSFNDGGACQYTSNESAKVDTRTRSGGILFTIAAGNSPEGCTGNYVRSPGTAKNGITMGSTDNFTLSTWNNQLTGNTCAWNTFPPTPPGQDARRIPSYSALRDPSSLVKPDLVAPSTRVTGPISRSTNICTGAGSILCNGTTPIASPDGINYAFSAGTSFAAPAAAGAAAVVRKWFKNNTGASPSPAMAKATLINGARDLGGLGVTVRNQNFNTVATVQHISFDPYQGWGMLSFERLFGTWANYYFYDQGTSFTTSGSSWTSPTLTVRDLTKAVQVTLVWTDPAGSATTTHYTVLNDLNLNVYAGINTVLNWQGNYLNVNTGMTMPRPPGILFRDSVNNVERVVLPTTAFNATHNTISITVTAFSLPQPAQNFALAVENAGQ